MFTLLVATLIVVGAYFIVRSGHASEQKLATDRWSAWANALVAKHGYGAPELKLTLPIMPPELARQYQVEQAPN